MLHVFVLFEGFRKVLSKSLRRPLLEGSEALRRRKAEAQASLQDQHLPAAATEPGVEDGSLVRAQHQVGCGCPCVCVLTVLDGAAEPLVIA